MYVCTYYSDSAAPARTRTRARTRAHGATTPEPQRVADTTQHHTLGSLLTKCTRTAVVPPYTPALPLYKGVLHE